MSVFAMKIFHVMASVYSVLFKRDNIPETLLVIAIKAYRIAYNHDIRSDFPAW